MPPFVLLAALVPLAVLAVVWTAVRRAIDRCLPHEPCLAPYPDADLLPATAARIADLRALGFEPLGGPHLANLQPAPTVLPFVHREAGLLAAVYEVQHPLPRTVLDFVTRLASGQMLTTTNAAAAAALPLPGACFLQTRPGGSTDDLLALHRDGVQTLRTIGQRPLGAASTTLADCLRLMAGCVRDQRASFDRAPARTTATALWRTLLRRDPYRRPLACQPRLRRELAGSARQ